VNHRNPGMVATGQPGQATQTMRSVALDLGRLAAREELGERGVLSLLAGAVGERLEADAVLISRVDQELRTCVDVAVWGLAPGSVRVLAGVYQLRDYPATRAVLATGTPYTASLDDHAIDLAERDMLEQFGYTAILMLRMPMADGPLLIEIFSEQAGYRFTGVDAGAAGGLLAETGDLFPAARERDEERERRFEQAVAAAEELGVADQSVAADAVALGEAMGLEEHELRVVRLVALVHEVAGLAVPPAMRSKREWPTAVEWAVLQRATTVGRRAVERRPSLGEAGVGVESLRERWDGDGYPHGLAGTEIPVAARIVQVCATYRALLAGRSYRPPRPHGRALVELREQAGSQFDPAVVEAACTVLRPEGAHPVSRLRRGAASVM
jgi:HD-GYP domain-containing protein (c-di-GMP phosphodiesterase class II)